MTGPGAFLRSTSATRLTTLGRFSAAGAGAASGLGSSFLAAGGRAEPSAIVACGGAAFGDGGGRGGRVRVAVGGLARTGAGVPSRALPASGAGLDFSLAGAADEREAMNWVRRAAAPELAGGAPARALLGGTLSLFFKSMVPLAHKSCT